MTVDFKELAKKAAEQYVHQRSLDENTFFLQIPGQGTVFTCSQEDMVAKAAPLIELGARAGVSRILVELDQCVHVHSTKAENARKEAEVHEERAKWFRAIRDVLRILVVDVEETR